jgi:hypothetical protein
MWGLALVLIWLAIISMFDLRHREVPHTAWVAIPLVGAMVYQAVFGNWQLTFLSAVVALVSERKRLAELAELNLGTIIFWSPFILTGIYLADRVNPFGAIAIIGFWLAWELHCWGGADAVTSIALVLIWPDVQLILALLAVHALVAIITTGFSLLKERRWRVHQLPGLPLLFLSVLLRAIIQG